MLKTIDIKDFDAVFRLLESSFPKDEYRPYELQKKLFENSLYRIYGVWDADDLVAFIAIWEFETFVFVEHFAVEDKFRGKGIGATVLKELRMLYDKMLCLEVELPDNDLATRRIDFYKRNGFYLNEYPYVQPSMAQGRNPIPLLIMTNGGRVDINAFGIIKDTLYKYVYNVK